MTGYTKKTGPLNLLLEKLGRINENKTSTTILFTNSNREAHPLR
jgi:hypothetical protein